MSDIDPVRLDVLAKPRRRRRANVPENMKPALAEAEERARARPAVPGLMIEPTPGDEDHPTFHSPWVDKEACELMLADCFATRSVATFQTFVDQIAGLCRKRWNAARHMWVRDEGELNQALNFVNGLRPRNEGEAALCVKLYANYQMGMRIAGRSLSGGWVDPKDSYAIAALDRAYAQLWESLNRGRGKTTRQKIVVKRESHVHHHQHVHLAEGGGSNSGSQSDGGTGSVVLENARPARECAALPSPQQGGQSVRTGGGERQAGLRQSRRSGGRSQGATQRQLPARRDDD